jgi:predicted TIM-barrel fold metal-dependent hydrolase
MPSVKPAHQRYLADLAALAGSLDIVDVHQHAGGWGAAPSLSPLSDGGAAERAALLDQYGIDAVCLMTTAKSGSSPDEVRATNAEALGDPLPARRIVSRLVTVPLQNIHVAIAELERSLADGATGLTFHHQIVGSMIDAPVMWPILEEAGARRLPVFLHVAVDAGPESIFRAQRLIGDFPQVKFVLLGAFVHPWGGQWAQDLISRCANVWVDTVTTFPLTCVIEQFVAECGHEKVMFGTDLYVAPAMYRFPGALLEILASPLGPEAKSAILGGNARQLLG